MTFSKKLIVNADGFGFGAGATQGIFDAIREGEFISSVSVNANFPEAERVRDLVKEFPDVSVGVHLNPLVGKPCLSVDRVPSLVGDEGYFHNEQFGKFLKEGQISMAELEAELDAQIHKVKTLVGDRLTHLDSHQNRHLDDYWEVFLRLAQKWGIHHMRNNASLICLESPTPRRSRLIAYSWKPHVWLMHQHRKMQMDKARSVGMRMADRLVTVGYAGLGGKSKIENWKRMLHNLPAGTYEIYCHPAYPDDTLRRWAQYCDDRALELTLLRIPDLGIAAKNLGIELIGFSKL